MKKLFLLTLLFSISACSFAQTVSFGVKAGVNIYHTNSPNVGGVAIGAENITGFHAGGVVDLRYGSFSIQPGVLFSVKGGKNTLSISNESQTQQGTGNFKTTLNYIEVPVNFLCRAAARGGEFFFGGGPYIGYGLSGKSSFDSDVSGQPVHQTAPIKFGSEDFDRKNPDFGVNVLAGYQLKNGLALSAGYGIGLANTAHNAAGAFKNMGFSFSIGYFFK